MTQQLRSQGPVSINARCAEELTRSEGGEEANGVGCGIRVRGGNGGGVGNRVGDQRTNIMWERGRERGGKRER